MCLGVYGRGIDDEVDWDKEDHEGKETRKTSELSTSEAVWESLAKWNGEDIVATQCTNTGAVIEWVFVPFIIEDDSDVKPSNLTEETSHSVDEL